MDSKDVTKEINLVIRPLLKENGFKKFSGRTYWRDYSDRIDILNFQSFNSYNAEVIGCTTYSFSVNLAVFLKYIPKDGEINDQNKLLRPKEYEGHFRKAITKGINQEEFPRKDIWLVNPDETNLKAAVADCKIRIESEAFDWFENFESKQNILQILLENEPDMEDTWGFGNYDSPNRNLYTAYTAIQLGEVALAIDKLSKLLSFNEEQYNKMKYPYYLKKVQYFKEEIEKLKAIS